MPRKPKGEPEGEKPEAPANDALHENEQLETKLVTGDPRDLAPLEKNARRMSSQQFNRLVDNVKRDGALTSIPLVYPKGDKKVIVSGNHRVKAAVAAGLDQITWMEIVGELSEERFVAIQLSHNAITGEDDPNILKDLYDSMGVMEKLYSGLTDADFGNLDQLDLTKLAIGTPRYREISLMFLEEDQELFIGLMEDMGKRAKGIKRFHARLRDFQQFEDALVMVQDGLDIHNQALAVQAMAELAIERLQQLETEKAEQENNDDGE